jgi:flagellar biosynthesis protein FliR
MALFNLNWSEVLSLYFVLLRLSAATAVVPWLGDRMISPVLRILFTLLLSLVLFPLLKAAGHITPQESLLWWKDAATLVRVSMTEVFFGLFVGFMTRMVFEVFQMGANLCGQFMGLSMATIYDPHQESQAEILSALQNAFTYFFFFGVNGHLILIQGLFNTYRFVGIGQVGLSAHFADALIKTSGHWLLSAVQISAPILVGTFGVNLLFGMFARALPQVNIFAISALVTLGVGLLILTLAHEEIQLRVVETFEMLGDRMNEVSQLLRKGTS